MTTSSLPQADADHGRSWSLQPTVADRRGSHHEWLHDLPKATRSGRGGSPYVRWDVTDPDRRRDLYEIVLVEGALDDITRLIDGPGLVEVWDRMYLPQRVRAAWRPLIDNSRTAA